jgi:uncharacterized protein (TIGR02231 family)
MRHLLLAAILSTSLLLSHTAVQAQEKGLDEFEAFRNKLNANKASAAGAAVKLSPDDEEEDVSLDPIAGSAGNPGMGLPVKSNTGDGLQRVAGGYGATPQTPEELQAMMEQEQEDARRKIMDKALKGIEIGKYSKEIMAVQVEGAIVVQDKITAVTVYSDRAKVTRHASVEIPAGKGVIAFTDMPFDLVSDSLRAEGHASAQVTFGAVSLKKIFVANAASPHELELYKQYEPLKDRQKFIDAERAALVAKKSFLLSLGQHAATSSNEEIKRNDLKSQQWMIAANDIHAGILDTMKANVELDIKQRELEEEIARIKGELQEFGKKKTNAYVVMVPLEAEKATKLEIDLSYQVTNATWFPLYDARLDTKGEKLLQLTQYGVVKQRTGEDWQGVSLALSTARPQLAASLPYLKPIWIDAELVSDLAVPPQVIGAADPLAEWRQKAEARRLSLESETAPPESEDGAPQPVPMVTPIRAQDEYHARLTPAIIETGGFVSEYKIPGPANVLSDGSDTKLMIGNFDAQSEMQVHVKPQLSTDAYLVAQMKLKGDAPILPGAVNLFRDGAFIGQSNIPLLRPDEEYDLSFGIDDQVAVKRNTLKDENKEEGMISKDNVIERQYVTEIENLHVSPVKLVVKEMIPTSKNEKVVVDIRKDFTTDGYVMDAKNIKGLMHWKLDMPAKSQKEIKLGWRVTWPKDHRLKGL